MKKLILTIALIAAGFTTQAQTNVTSETIWDILTTGTNYFVVPFATASLSGNAFGGGVAVGYKATAALQPMVRLQDFDSKLYVANISLQLQVPRTLMGKVPIVPFVVAGAGIPVNTATVPGGVTISAGDPIAIAGAGAWVPLDWISPSSTFLQSLSLFGDYEHWTGASLPTKDQNQANFGLSYSF